MQINQSNLIGSISPNDIVILPKPDEKPPASIAKEQISTEQVSTTFVGFRRLDAELWLRGIDTNERLITLIIACIEAGFDHGKRITGTMAALGFKRQHAGLILSMHTGRDPSKHFWQKLEDHRYSVLQAD